MRRLLPAMLLVVAISTLSSAASLSLAPERPVSPITAEPAADSQGYPTVAADSAGHTIAIWADNRLRTDACPNCLAIYGTRLDDSGQPLDPFGIRIGDGAIGHIASDGNSFLVVYTDRGGMVWSQRLGADAHPTEAPVQLTQQAGSFVALASNGRTYLALIERGNLLSALVLDGNGRLAATSTFPTAGLAVFALPRIVVVSGQYHVVRESSACATQQSCSSWVEDVTVDDNGTMASRTIDSAASQWFQVAAASSDQGMLFAWITDVAGPGHASESVEYEFVSNDGKSDGRKTVATIPISAASAMNIPLVLWDGREFRLLWQQAQNGVMQLVGARVSEAGALLDATPAVVATTSTGVFYPQAITSTRLPSGANVILWSNGSDVYDLLLPNAETATGHAQLLDYSGSQQNDAAMASNTVVWSEASGAGRTLLESTAGTAPVVIATADTAWQSPAVASNGATTFVVWIESSAGHQRLLAKRVTPSGMLLDAQPRVIADEAQQFASGVSGKGPLSIASNGNGFLIVWPLRNEVHAFRIDASGKPLDAAPIVVARFSDPNLDAPYRTQVVWTESGWIVGITNTRFSGLLVSPSPAWDSIYLARVTREGVPLDNANPILVTYAGWAGAPVSIAHAAGRVIVVWPRLGMAWDDAPQATLSYQLFTPDGVALQPTPQQLFGGTTGAVLDADVATVGSSFLVGASVRPGSGRFVVRGWSVAPDGTAGEPFDLSPAGFDATGVAVASSPSLLAVGYTRVASEAGDVGRVFTRSVVPATRSRAVR